MDLWIVFRNKTIADTLLGELAFSPFQSVVLFATERDPGFGYDEQGNCPEGLPNVVSYVYCEDGRCAIAHAFCEEDEDYIEAYLQGYIVSGDVWTGEQLPSDWVYPTEPS